MSLVQIPFKSVIKTGHCAKIMVAFFQIPQFENSPVYIHHLIVDRGLSKGLMITDLKIGRTSQLRTTGCLPAYYFEHHSECGLHLDPVLPGNQATIEVQNIADEDLLFGGTILADVEKPKGEKVVLGGFGLTKFNQAPSLKVHVQNMDNMMPVRIIIPSDVIQNLNIKVKLKETPVEIQIKGDVITLINAPVMRPGDWVSVELQQLKPQVDQNFTGVLVSKLL